MGNLEEFGERGRSRASGRVLVSSILVSLAGGQQWSSVGAIQARWVGSGVRRSAVASACRAAARAALAEEAPSAATAIAWH